MSRGLSESVTYDEAAVEARYGLKPEQMVDYKGLRGDPSDNIPGVRGIGEKTATELLKEFKTLDELYEAIDTDSKRLEKVKPRILGLLKQYREDAFLSKRLATIKRDVPIDFDLEKVKFGEFDKAELVKLFSELEFKSLLPRVQELGSSVERAGGREEEKKEQVDKFTRNKELFKYSLVDSDEDFEKFLVKLKKQKEFVIDTETTSLDPLTTGLLGVSFSWKEGEAYYINFKSHNAQRTTHNVNLFNFNEKQDEGGLERKDWLEKLGPILGDEGVKKYGHNTKFDLRVLENKGMKARGIVFDTMIASYLLNPGSRQHNLDAITFTELGFEKISKEDLLGKGKEKVDFGEVALEKMYIYSCEDADFTFRLVKKLSKELKDNKLEKLFEEIEMPLVYALGQMEDTGIMLDNKFLDELRKNIDKKIKKLEAKIKGLAGMDFNINSTQQLREVLFEKLEIPTNLVSKTKTGLSTAADELAKLKDLHPIIVLIQEYRELNKLSTTYINAFPELVSKKTGRLHTCYNQTVTATGRLSSTEPNLQNIPIRTELGREIRKAFVADKGYKLLSLDYSQIELRLAAHMSGDKRMIEAFQKEEDIHTATAAAINGIGLDEVTPELRREAKAVNFGILYGQGSHGLAQAADISYGRAKEFIEGYFKVYEDVKKYVDESIESAREKGYAETLFGRRRYLPEINSSVVMVRKGAERMAINTPLQGTAADMIKVAMIKIAREIDWKSVKMLLQVHDELLFEIEEDKVEKAVKKIKDMMENVIKLKVPIIVDAKVGDNWGEMEKI